MFCKKLLFSKISPFDLVIWNIFSKQNIDNIVTVISKKGSLDILVCVFSVDIFQGSLTQMGKFCRTIDWEVDPGQHRNGRAKGEVSRMQRYLWSQSPKVQNGKRFTREAAGEQISVQLQKAKAQETKDPIEKLHDKKKKRTNLEKREAYCRIELKMKER